MFIILFNEKDAASMNMRKNLLGIGIASEKTAKLITISEDFLSLDEKKIEKILHENRITERKENIRIIFASKHRSEKNIKSLTVHPVGLFEQAEGLTPIDAILQTTLFRNLVKIHDEELEKEGRTKEYEVTFEVTHHTPILSIPSVFIEIGSTEKEWNDRFAGKLIAETIANSIREYEDAIKSKDGITIAVGIGGPHYAPNFSKYVLRNLNTYIGHMCAKYNLSHLTKEKVAEMLDKSKSKDNTTNAKYVIILDWKGLGEFKEKIKQLLEDRDYIKIK